MGAPRIQVKALSFAFANTRPQFILNEVNLSVPAGAFISILGPSGCGKTTLLRLMAGLLRPFSGSVLLDNIEAAQACNSINIGFVHQHPVLFGWRTVREHVSFPGEIMRRKDLIRDSQRFIEMVGLAGFENYYPHQLSGGMQSRLCLARTLACEPSILLLDEPFASLDEITRDTLNIDLLRVWRDTGATVVMVTHRPEEAILMSDTIYLVGGSPATLKASIEIGFHRPRSLELLEAPEFRDLLRMVRISLRSAASDMNLVESGIAYEGKS
jgi:NitT/TauT family transport system ATP-binding protein